MPAKSQVKLQHRSLMRVKPKAAEKEGFWQDSVQWRMVLQSSSATVLPMVRATPESECIHPVALDQPLNLLIPWEETQRLTVQIRSRWTTSTRPAQFITRGKACSPSSLALIYKLDPDQERLQLQMT